MREPQRQVQLLALGLGAIAHTDQLQLLFETLGDTLDHVIHQRTRGTCQRHGRLGAVPRSKAQDIRILADLHRVVNGVLK